MPQPQPQQKRRRSRNRHTDRQPQGTDAEMREVNRLRQTREKKFSRRPRTRQHRVAESRRSHLPQKAQKDHGGRVTDDGLKNTGQKSPYHASPPAGVTVSPHRTAANAACSRFCTA